MSVASDVEVAATLPAMRGDERQMREGYIICGTPRTGSTLLCDLLAATKVAGHPESFFMRGMDPHWAAQLGLPSRDGLSEAAYAAAYLTAAIKAGKGGTKVFGLRLMRENLEDLIALIDAVHPQLPSDKARLDAAFGDILYLHLARADKLGQAISMVKAEQTGLWHIAPDGTELERLAPPQDPIYDFDRLARKLAELQAYDDAWGIWFEEQGIAPLRIAYEDLSRDPVAIVARICAALGVPAPDLANIRPGVARLADATSADWRARYCRDVGAVV
jgi:LPS sulfotransferase NodH